MLSIKTCPRVRGSAFSVVYVVLQTEGRHVRSRKKINPEPKQWKLGSAIARNGYRLVASGRWQLSSSLCSTTPCPLSGFAFQPLTQSPIVFAWWSAPLGICFRTQLQRQMSPPPPTVLRILGNARRRRDTCQAWSTRSMYCRPRFHPRLMITSPNKLSWWFLVLYLLVL